MSIPVASASASPCLTHGCAECCWDTQMPLTEEDARRLAGLGHDVDAFSRIDAEDHARYLRTRDEPREDGKRPCFFLKDEKCSVYADRPAGCRIYPFVLTVDGRVIRDEDCPHRREFKQDPAIGRRLLRVATTIQREAGARRP